MHCAGDPEPTIGGYHVASRTLLPTTKTLPLALGCACHEPPGPWLTPRAADMHHRPRRRATAAATRTSASTTTNAYDEWMLHLRHLNEWVTAVCDAVTRRTGRLAKIVRLDDFEGFTLGKFSWKLIRR